MKDFKKERCEKRPLYNAMNKYGPENFSIEQIEECNSDIVNEQEIYWIEFYGSFKNGYNATFGGDGKHYADYERTGGHTGCTLLKEYQKKYNRYKV